MHALMNIPKPHNYSDRSAPGVFDHAEATWLPFD